MTVSAFFTYLLFYLLDLVRVRLGLRVRLGFGSCVAGPGMCGNLVRVRVRLRVRFGFVIELGGISSADGSIGPWCRTVVCRRLSVVSGEVRVRV